MRARCGPMVFSPNMQALPPFQRFQLRCCKRKQAPVDLAAVAADFAVDEMVHVTLVAKLVMALGGAAPYMADLANIAPRSEQTRPLLRAAEFAIRISCVGEALSLPALSAWHRGATHPLLHSVLERLRHDEGPHAAIGHWFLEWAAPQLSAGDREYLGAVATEAIEVYEPLWQGKAGANMVAGKHGPVRYDTYMQNAVDERIVAKLRRHDILIGE
jgi:hypothetical protein